MRVAYVRVSSEDQNEARQMEALQKYDIEKWFVEKISGKDMNRPKLQEMREFIREGDTVYIHDFSRLARSTADLLTLTDEFRSKGVFLVSNKENIDSSTATGKLMLTMIAAINEFERANIRERQREGIEIAKKNGVYKGRKRKIPEKFDACYEKYLSDRSYSKVQMAKDLGVSRPTIDKLIQEAKKTIAEREKK